MSRSFAAGATLTGVFDVSGRLYAGDSADGEKDVCDGTSVPVLSRKKIRMADVARGLAMNHIR